MKRINIPIQSIVNDYLSGMSAAKVGKKYNISKKTVLRRLKKSGTNTRTISDACRKYSLNTCFFEKIDNEQKAYWLGFILADGNIGTGGRYQKSRSIRIALQRRDENHLLKFKASIGSTHPIKQKDEIIKLPSGVPARCISSWLCIASVPLTKPLEESGWHKFKRKGNTKILESVPCHLVPHLLRGLIDGDGWIHHDKRRPRWILGFCDFHKAVVEWARDQIEKMGFPSGVQAHQAKQQKVWKICYSSKQVPHILRSLYQGSSIYLDRKFNLAIQSFGQAPPLKSS